MKPLLTPIIPHAGRSRILYPLLESLETELAGFRPLVGDDSHRLPRLVGNSHAVVYKGPRRGFAANVNALAARVRTPWIVLLNNDTFLHKGWGKRIQWAMRAVPKDVGMIATVVWQEDGTIDSFGDSFSYILGRPLKRARGSKQPLRAAAAPLLSVSGAVMVVRRKMWEELGGFDERFGQYYEDVDFGWRAMAAGWKMESFAECHSTHQEGQTFPAESRAYFGARNNLWLLRRHLPKDKDTWRNARLAWEVKAKRWPELSLPIHKGIKDGLKGRLSDAPSAHSAGAILRAKRLPFLHEAAWLWRDYGWRPWGEGTEGKKSGRKRTYT